MAPLWKLEPGNLLGDKKILKQLQEGAATVDGGVIALPGVAGVAGGRGVMTATFRNGDRFTTRHQEGNLVITVTGKVAGGKTTVSEIHVRDGGESHDYPSLEKVPERYRDKVKNLIEMSEKGNAHIEVEKP
jgi:hypothetical protein